LRSGSFHEEGALSVEDLRSRWPDDVACRLISMADALAGIPTVYVDGRYAVRLRRGHQPTVQDLNGNNMPSLAAGDVVKFVLESGELVAVGAALHDSGRRLFWHRMRGPFGSSGYSTVRKFIIRPKDFRL